MKLGRYMYHLSTFHLPRIEGINQLAGGGASKKEAKNAMTLA